MNAAQVFQPSHHESFENNPDIAIIGGGRTCMTFLQTLAEKSPHSTAVVIDSFETHHKDTDTIEHKRDKIIAVTERPGGWLLKGITGKTYAAKKILLASGFYPPIPPHLHLMDYAPSGQYVNNPRLLDMDSINREQNILIFGSGQTSIKIIKQLHDLKHLGEIFTLSRHGLTPLPLGHNESHDPFANKKPSNHLPTLFAQLREEAKSHSWASIADGMKPHLDDIWMSFSLEDKEQFIRHLRSYWRTIAHRLDENILNLLFHMKASNQLHNFAGFYRTVEDIDGRLAVQFYERRTHEVKVMIVDRIINATGPNYNYMENDDLLIQNLINQNFIIPQASKLGLEINDNYAAISPAPRISEKLFLMGALTKGKIYSGFSEPAMIEQAEVICSQL